jgi:putative ABC transport system permease protein
MRRRPGRAFLTLLGIVIGVAAAVAVSVTVRTTRTVHRDMFDSLTGRAALEVVADGMGGFDPAVSDRLRDVPGLRAVVPVIQSPAAVLGKSGGVPILVLGIDPARDSAARDCVLRDGRALDDGDGVLLAYPFAQAHGFELGRPVRFLAPSGTAAVPVIGFVEPRGPAAFNGGAVAFLPLPTAQRLFGLSGQVNSLQLVLDESATAAAIGAEVRGRLPAGLEVQPPGARGELARETMVSTEQGLEALSVSSLAAGAFVVLNAFLMNLGERRRQLAILRSVGATRRQVSGLLLREAVWWGVAGSCLGIPLGLALASAMRAMLGVLLIVSLTPLRWGAEPFVIGALLGPGMAVAATLTPARRAGRRAPLEDLLQKTSARSEDVRRWPGYVGLGVLLAVLLFAAGIIGHWFPAPVVLPLLAPAMAGFLVGCALAVPLILTPLSGLASLLLRPLRGAEGVLALRQLLRHRTRTGLTVGVLHLAVVFAVGFGLSFRNNMRHVNEWFARIIQTDFYVRGSWPDATMNITTPALPEAMVAEVAGQEGVERVDYISFVLARAGGRPVVALAYSFAPDRPVPLPLVEGGPEAVRQGLAGGDVVLGTPLAQRLGLHAGDAVEVETRAGPRSLRIAGTASEYTGGGMAVYLEWQTARRLFDLKGVHAILVTARPGAARQLEARLKAFCAERGLLFQSNADVHEFFGRQVRGMLGFIWVLMSLVFVVASLGVVNTLTVNVLEQTRELGVLRAIGMRRAQVARLVLAQAIALAVVSLVPGVAAGVALAWLTNLATYPVVGQAVRFHWDWALIAGCFFTALAIAVGAALVPARRAARLRVVEALQYE